jgi:DNA ligase-1
MKFKELSEAFEIIEKESSRTQMTIMLADLFKKATPHEAVIISYLSLGSLNPPHVGTQFNFAEKSLFKVIARLQRQSLEQIKVTLGSLGDCGLVVGQGGWRPTVEEPLTITDVNKALVKIHSITGLGSQEVKEELIEQLLRSLDPLSAKFVVRIILGKLRMGFSDMTLLDAFSWMACGDKSIREPLENAYNVCADIGRIIKLLKDEGVKGIEHMTIVPGIPIRPAAAERMESAEAIFEKLGNCVAQPKLDGFRLQVHFDQHRSKTTVHFFSRNLQDMSQMFPDLAQAVEQLPVDNAILEGEAISYDAETGSFLPFQETVKRKRKHGIDKIMQDFPLRLYFFDLLYLNDQSLLDEPHSKRRALMLELFEDKAIAKSKVMIPIQEEKIKDAKHLKEYFEQNVSAGLEGVVVKRIDAPYQAGKRNFNWIKLKREESGALEDTIDCVILGYYFGQGKRAAFGIGALLVGVYNQEKDCFQTVAKIGTGMTDGEWKTQKKECDELRVANRPANVECAKELYPNVWVHPKIVCMIRADEITLSPLHTAGKTLTTMGYALRFPRFMGYRPDKDVMSATTVKEIASLYRLQFEKKKKKTE